MRVGEQTRRGCHIDEMSDAEIRDRTEANDAQTLEILDRVGAPKSFRENRLAGFVAHGYQHEGRNDLRLLENGTTDEEGKPIRFGVCTTPGCECHAIAKERGFGE